MMPGVSHICQRPRCIYNYPRLGSTDCPGFPWRMRPWPRDQVSVLCVECTRDDVALCSEIKIYNATVNWILKPTLGKLHCAT